MCFSRPLPQPSTFHGKHQHSLSLSSDPLRAIPKTLPVLLTIAAFGLSGCEGTNRSSPPRRAVQRQAPGGGDILFQNVATNLNNLDSYINTNVNEPVAVLHAAHTSDEQPVMATLIADPDSPAQQFNYLVVPSRNSQFIKNDIRAGDILRFFITRDEFGKATYQEFTVFEVVNDYTLRLGQALSFPIYTATRAEIWRRQSQQLERIVQTLRDWIRTGEPAFGWEPSPELNALDQIVDRLNQWIRRESAPNDWTQPALLDTLDASQRDLPQVQRLNELSFDRQDVRGMQEAVWLRDTARVARRDAIEDVPIAVELFDWTVRNLQLETKKSLEGVLYDPWKILLYGRGTAEQRAWVFMLLARQLGLDVVRLQPANAPEPGAMTPCLTALFSGGELYLFDCALGLPLPSADGQGVGTLAELAASEEGVSLLDLDEERKYPYRAEHFQEMAAFVEASPTYIAKRSAMIEQKLVGSESMVLTVPADKLAERLKEVEQISEVSVWPFSYELLEQQSRMEREQRRVASARYQFFAGSPLLYKGRLLYLKGQVDEEEGAMDLLLRCRPSNERIEAARILPSQKNILLGVKEYASYWLGIMTYDKQDYEVAVDWFLDRTIKLWDEGTWKHGATYNLARTYEAQGEFEKAREFYTATPDSPQHYGNSLRASRLPAAETTDP